MRNMKIRATLRAFSLHLNVLSLLKLLPLLLIPFPAAQEKFMQRRTAYPAYPAAGGNEFSS